MVDVRNDTLIKRAQFMAVTLLVIFALNLGLVFSGADTNALAVVIAIIGSAHVIAIIGLLREYRNTLPNFT